MGRRNRVSVVRAYDRRHGARVRKSARRLQTHRVLRSARCGDQRPGAITSVVYINANHYEALEVNQPYGAAPPAVAAAAGDTGQTPWSFSPGTISIELLNLVKVMGHSVLGTVGVRAKDANSTFGIDVQQVAVRPTREMTLVDSAGYDIITDRPRSAGGVSRAIYQFVGLTFRNEFPSEVQNKLNVIGDALLFTTNSQRAMSRKKEVIEVRHAASPPRQARRATAATPW